MGIYDTMCELERISKKLKICTVLPTLLMGIGIILFVFGKYVGGIAFILFFGVSWFVCSPQVFTLKNQYKKLYKETFVVSMLKTMLDDVKYDWYYGFTETDVIQYGLVKIGNRFMSEDYLSGSYKGVKFRQADVESLDERWNGEETETVTYFRGRLIEFDYPIKLFTSVKVLSKYFKTHIGLPDNNIAMEDVEFNSSFNVYSSDPHEAFYILTPPLMEKLKLFKNKYGNFAFNFAQGKLYFAIQNQNSFDAEYMTKISYVEEQERMKKDVQVIIDIINILGLI